MKESVLRSLGNRVGNLIIRAVVALTGDSTLAQTVQVTGRDGEVKDGLEHWLPYGLTFRVRPPDGGKGAEALILAIDRDHRVALPAMDRRFRPHPLKLGEVQVHDWQGQKVHFYEDGILIETDRPDGVTVRAPKVLVDAPEITLIGQVTVKGNVTVEGHIDASGHIIDGGGNTNHHSH